MTSPDVSLVIVSRERPGWLSLCLTAVGQLRYDRVEVIVVADGVGMGPRPSTHWGRI